MTPKRLLGAAVLVCGALWLGVATRNAPDPGASGPQRAPAVRAEERAPVRPSTRSEVLAGIPVRVVAGGEPVAGARVAYRRIGSVERGEPLSGTDGTVRLPSEGRYVVLVEAPGFRTRREVVDVLADHAFLLVRTGSLRLRFHDANGRAVSGIGVRLRPGDLDGGSDPPNLDAAALEHRAWRSAFDRLLATDSRAREEDLMRELDSAAWIDRALDVGDLERRSGEDGTVRFAGLPPGGGYRWELLEDVVVAMQPPTEPAVEVLEDGSLRRGRALPRTLSGPFEIEPGGESGFEVAVSRPGRIEGRIHSPILPLDVEWSYVRLRDGQGLRNPERDRRGPAAAPSYASFRQEALVRPDEEGRFAFEGVWPGYKMVTAAWVARAGGRRHAFFATVLLTVAGDDHHVDLHPEGHDLDLTAGLVSESGERLDPAEVFGDRADVAWLEVRLNSGRGVPRSADVTEPVPLRFGETVHVHGLHPGQYQVQHSAPFTGWPEPRPPFGLQDRHEERYFQVPETRALDLDVTVRAVCRVAIELDRSAYPGWFMPVVHLREERSGAQNSVGLSPRSADGRVYGEIELPAGDYAWWMVFDGSRAAPDDVVPFASGFLTVPGAERHAVELEGLRPGVTVSGTAFEADGRPLSGLQVKFTHQALLGGPGEPPWLYWARADEQGRFTLRGVEPGRTLVGWRMEPPVAVGAGPTSGHVLRIRK